jgi:NHL repeat
MLSISNGIREAQMNIPTTCRLFVRAICVGMVMLICTNAHAQNLFVSDNVSGTIYEYTPDGMRSTFATGLAGPAGLAFNNNGNLFVADVPSGNIYQYSRTEHGQLLPLG